MSTRDVLLTVALFLPSGLAPAQPAPAREAVRQDLDYMARALDGAVRRVSRASSAYVIGPGESCRGYLVPGYGAVFVLSPRVLPAQVRRAPLAVDTSPDAEIQRSISLLEASLRNVDPEIRAQVQAQLDQLKRMQQIFRMHRRPIPQPADLDKELRELEAQVEELHKEAQRAQEEAFQALERIMPEVRDLRDKGGLTEVAGPQPPATSQPALPAPSVAPPGETTAIVAGPPAPPWRFWTMREETRDTRSPESIVSEVRQALAEALATYGGRLRVLRPEDHVAAAVDFCPQGTFVARTRPVKTLTVRLRKKELEEARLGKISFDELRKRVEYSEY